MNVELLNNNVNLKPLVMTNSLIAINKLHNLSFKGDTFEDNNNSRTEFCNEVCSYQQEKEEFYDKFLLPIINSNNSTNVQPSILLCSPDDSVVINFLNAIVSVSVNNKLNIVDLSEYVNSGNFMNIVHNQLKQSKEYYNRTGKRSIIILNNAERFLGMNFVESCNYTNVEYDSNDIEILKSNRNATNVTGFKSLLDTCHYLPTENSSGCATTFIFKSEHPHLMHPHLRDGKMKKFYIEALKDENLIHCLIEQFNRAKESLAETYYRNFWSGNIDEQHLQNALENLKNINFADNMLAIGLLNVFLSVNQFTGGYTAKTINTIMKQSLIKKLECENIPFILLFANIINKTPRDITPAKVKKYNQIQNSILKQLDDYDKLMQLKEDGMLTPANEAELNNLIENEKNILKFLKSKKSCGLITPDECLLLEKLNNRYN